MKQVGVTKVAGCMGASVMGRRLPDCAGEPCRGPDWDSGRAAGAGGT